MQHSEFSWQGRSGRTIYAQSWQPEGEPHAVTALVHGLGEHSGRYKHIAEAFTYAGYALIAMDLPGHGKSSGPRGFTSFDEISLETAQLLDEAAARLWNSGPDTPLFLYGHSLGGAAVLYHVLKTRPRLCGVISTSPGIMPGFPVPAPKLALARLMARVMPSFTLPSGLDRSNLSRLPEVITAYSQDPLVHDRVSARLGLDILTRGEWLLAHAGEFPLPLLLVQGSDDYLVSTEATRKFAEAVPAGRLTYKVWEGFYHETHNEPEKNQVIQYIVDWIDAHIPG